MAHGERTEYHPNRQVGREVMLPRLSAAMQRQGILSEGEAQSAIRGLKSGDTGGGGEAVWHYGGAQKLASDAYRNRRLGMAPRTPPSNVYRNE